MKTPRDRWLSLDDAGLLADCDVDTYRASGPGGQKRNKTSSAVRLRHRPSGLIVIAEESRSQHENKAKAVRRLRMAIALSIRIEPGGDSRATLSNYKTRTGRIEVSTRNSDYPLVVAAVLDEITACAGRMQEAAANLGHSTAQLARFVTDDGKVLDIVNRQRRELGLKPLTPSK
ncbi:MAG TPA: peptide chain release factor-like protein [Phycisphaerae bacterium]|nr:peptide chain release factor-like protein [Phycisphaerae bacterium]